MVLIVSGILLASFNSTPVPFDYYFGQRHLPLSILLSFAFIFGLLLAGLFMIVHVVKFKWLNHKLAKQMKVQSNEIIELKKKLHVEQEKNVSTEITHSPVNPI
jgi:putative membrane protein